MVLILSYCLMNLPLSLFLRHFLPPLQDILPNTTDKVEKILNDDVIATSDGGTRRYLVCRKGKASIDDA